MASLTLKVAPRHLVARADLLPPSIAFIAFAPFVLASAIMAGGYATTFVLPDTLVAQGISSVAAGGVISAGIVTTILSCCFAGHLAQRLGVMGTFALAAAAMAGAMLCFSLIGTDWRAAYVGEMLVGAAWSVAAILPPLQIFKHVRPSARMQYLNFLSGAQMAGIGAVPSIYRATVGGSTTRFYLGFAGVCLAAVACIEGSRRAMAVLPKLQQARVSLRLVDATALLGTRLSLPIVMILLSGCVFSGLSTFQSTYAASRHLRPDVFFLLFTGTSVLLRFAGAKVLGGVPVDRLIAVLLTLTAGSLALMLLNPGNPTLYIASTVMFATGYGLSYSTLNVMAVNLAERQTLSVAATSQIFALSYFIGLFGFPAVGGILIGRSGIDAMIVTLLVMVGVNLALVAALPRRRPKAR